ncbi:TetR/AcrR family transcriptional regulator [Antrihabitans cavernicola]|uniref:TetR/AcrR family transcriptional regulator n=1 Tax=Antrihabitans cavernicola TaxID=2495913 RepID=A0A5A7S665_9NOCA|nr:TetR/AcrR family transcriptional regulator [Spelaeibacter cavernicola]KAA0017672.1 TetR/AcrR family transcriptional regulator [Spelaeibacter cavernicola]
MSEAAIDEGRTAHTDGRTTRWDDHKAARKDRILEAAIDAINDGGSDIPVQEIADRAGLPRSVIYRIFKDRSDLDEQLRARIVDRLMAEVTPALTPRGTVGESIGRAVETYVGWIVDYPGLHQFLGTGSASRRTTGSRVVTGTKTAIGVDLAGLFDAMLAGRPQHAETAETLAFALLGLVDATVNRWLVSPGPRLSSNGLAAFLETSIWHVLDGALRDFGFVVTKSTPVSELVGLT